MRKVIAKREEERHEHHCAREDSGAGDEANDYTQRSNGKFGRLDDRRH